MDIAVGDVDMEPKAVQMHKRAHERLHARIVHMPALWAYVHLQHLLEPYLVTAYK